jgi:TolB-like protein/Flp pilus assembly protein TadD
MSEDHLEVVSGLTLDLARGCLMREGEPVHLRPLSYDVLKHLVEKRGRLVGKEELIERVWHGRAVTDGSIGKCIEEVRAALGADGRDFVRNVRGRGYIFEPEADVRPTGPEHQQPSIAVLPFADMSAARDHEWFSDGLAEEIINALDQIPGLKVIARMSAFAFKGKQEDVRRIAESLGVAHVLEGSVRKAGNRIRVTAQLIAARDGSHLWSERYDRELADVFAVQDDIAQAIAAVLKVKLAGKPAPIRRLTPTLPAYEAFLKAQHYFAKQTADSLARARDCYEQAIAFDRSFALAHNALGEYWFTLAFLGLQSARDAMPMVRAAAERALALHPSIPEAHGLLGVVAATYDYDWTESGRRFRLAMAQEPVPPDVRRLYGSFYLLLTGRPQDAAEELQHLMEGDPLNLRLRLRLAACLQAAGRDSDAFVQYREILELDESYWFAYLALGSLHASQGRLTDALACAEKAHALASWSPHVAGLLAGVLHRTGEVRLAEALLEKIGPGHVKSAHARALFYLVCGDIDRAADSVEKSIEERDPDIMVLLNVAVSRPLRSSLRWPALARLMNLPEKTTS